MKPHYSLIVLFIILLSISNSNTELNNKFQSLIDSGEFTHAQKLMKEEMTTNLALTPAEKIEMNFEIDRLERIKKEFNKKTEDVINYIQQYVPEVTEKDIERWENEKSLEYMIIDSEKRYFEMAASNLFLIDKKLRKLKEKQGKKDISEEMPSIYSRSKNVEEIIKEAKIRDNSYVKPTRLRITYSVAVKENSVPAGKIIRAWLPFPRELTNRQDTIKLITTEPGRYLLTGHDEATHKTIYFEAPAVSNRKTQFKIVFEYTAHAFYRKINPKFVKPAAIPDKLQPYIQEQPPHIVFTEELKALSRQIVGDETNPYKIAQRIFRWIDENIPWASARDYSTIVNLSKYAYENRHGDCGIQTMLFITLCRFNGIPAKWESGWTTTPIGKNMHDWSEIYLSPYEWMPVDTSFGFTTSKDEAVKWFYFGNIDNYRFIVNNDFSGLLYPVKLFPRSDTIDFQRGELEWEGGNLYYDQWNWNYQVEYLK